MSEYLITLILGVVQGITEFLPISSDGHLEIAKYFLGDTSSGIDSLEMTVILHMATTLSICYVFRRKIIEIFKGILNWEEATLHFVVLVVVSMIPAAIVGLFFEEEVASMFNGNITLVAACLVLNGIILWFGNQIQVTNQKITPWKAFGMGLAQMFAILPGISRSGSTISVAAMSQINRVEAAEFSFLMVLPLIFGKIGKDVLQGSFSHVQYSFGAMSVGFIASFVVGVYAFRLLLKLVSGIKLNYFAYYCIIVGLLLGLYSFIQK